MTDSPLTSTRDTRSSTLSIVALALAFILPLAGFILGLVARVRSKASGAPTVVATTAVAIGAILSVVWTVAIVLLLSIGGVLSGETTPTTPGTPAPSESAPASGSESGDELVIEVTAEREVDSTTLAAARTALAFYGENAGIEVVDVTETDADALTVTFGADVSSADIDAFARAISAPAAEGFYAVDAAHPATGGADLGDGSMTPPCDALRFGPIAVEEHVLACDEAMLTQLLLPSSARLVGNAIAEVEVSGDAVAVTLSDPAAEEFAAWTREASAATAPGNQIALVDFIGVISAPTVAEELAAEFQISGATLDAELLAARLKLLSAGASFTAR
ncbi:SecDF P1 head subdomain-containing protein [Microbacterium sp. CGR1]|uniref:SecDF P1 head subdomain-containing protein n=1 Tax=Microbacterium sp. CGR1 TaxID=1696072 RepID=UPI003DA5A267